LLTGWAVWQFSKQVVKSLLGAGNAWQIRVANHPKKELRVITSATIHMIVLLLTTCLRKTKRVNSRGNSAKSKLLKRSAGVQN
jgi:hypothetical protein